MPNPLSGLGALRAILAREAPAQAESILQALNRTARTGNETSVVGSSLTSNPNFLSTLTEGTAHSVIPNAADRRRALFSGEPIADFHTHPEAIPFSVRPSQADIVTWRNSVPDPLFSRTVSSSPEMRVMIATPPVKGDVGERAKTASMFFGTDRPRTVFNPNDFNNARYELQRGLSKGKLGDYMSDPNIRDAVENYGVDMADMVGEMSPLALMRHYDVNRGLGRSEINLGGVSEVPGGWLTDNDLFEFFTPGMLDLLKSKKLATGGLIEPVKKGCSCGH